MSNLTDDQKLAITECNKLVERIKEMSSKREFRYLDLRFFFLDAFIWTVTWTNSQLNTSTRVLTGKIIHDTPPPNLTKDQQNGVGRVLSFYDICTRTSFITSLMFQIEVFMKGLSAKLGLVPKNRSYNSIVETLVDAVITDDEEQKKKYLMAPAHVRNALHTNGYHMNKDFEVTINDKTYEFINKNEIDFGGWSQLFTFMNKALDVLEEIIFSSEINKIDYIEKESFLDLKTLS